MKNVHVANNFNTIYILYFELMVSVLGDTKVGEKDRMEKLDIEEFPSVREVGNEIESILKAIFKENYKRYVLRQDVGRFIILPPRYLHLPPILINVQSHPNDQNRALMINISRRIPIDSSESIPEIMSKIAEIIGADIEVLHRAYCKGSGASNKNGIQVYYLVLAHRLHVFSLKDKAWFLFILSSMIDVDSKLLAETSEEIIAKKEKENISAEYT